LLSRPPTDAITISAVGGYGVDGQRPIATYDNAVTVHVVGEVVNPGVHRLPAGSRIFQAIEMAGGFTPEADESSVNLAARIRDEQQIVVAGLSGTTAENPDVPRIVNINTADKNELLTLPGVGSIMADSIIAYRNRTGGFISTDELMNIPRFGTTMYESIQDRITID